jgi:capsular polysaccharide biosynthesis protein
MPRLLRALDSGLSSTTKLLVSNRWKNVEYVASSLATVKLNLESLELDEHVFAPRLVLPHARTATSYIHPAEIQRVLTHFLLAFNILPREASRKIWIHRSEKSRRALLNEEEVLQHVRNAGYEPVAFEELNLKQQIDLLQETKVLAGLHGAGLTNLMFLPKGATVLEFMPEEFAAYAHPFPYRSLAEAAQVNYAVSGMGPEGEKWQWTKPSQASTALRYQKVNAPRSLDIPKLTRAIKQCER